MSSTFSAKAGSLERLKDAMGLQAVPLPDALNRAQADADGLGHRAARPVGGFAGRLGAGQRQHLGDSGCRQGRLARRSRLVAQQTVEAFLGVATLPAPDRRPAHADAARDFENRQPICRMQNDTRPLDMLQRAAAVADDSGQSRAVLGMYDHTNFLSHDHRLAWPTENVNPTNASVH